MTYIYCDNENIPRYFLLLIEKGNVHSYRTRFYIKIWVVIWDSKEVNISPNDPHPPFPKQMETRALKRDYLEGKSIITTANGKRTKALGLSTLPGSWKKQMQMLSWWNSITSDTQVFCRLRSVVLKLNKDHQTPKKIYHHAQESQKQQISYSDSLLRISDNQIKNLEL